MTAQQTWDFRSRPSEGNDQLLQFDIATGNATPVAAPAGIKLSPKVLAGGLFGYRRAGPDAPGVAYSDGKTGPKGSDVHTATWSPDGKQVVYARIEVNRPTDPKLLYSSNPGFKLYGTAFLPSVSPDGKHVLTTRINPDGSCQLFVIDEGQPARAIYTTKDFHTQLLLAPQWSADGKQIVIGIGAFTAFLDFDAGNKKPMTPDNGGAQTAILNADGTGFHIVTSGTNNNAFASFGPDGKHILYRTSGVEGEGLRSMNLEDHAITRITDSYDNFPIWSPEGDVVAFIRRVGTNFNIFTIRPDGTGLKQLTNTRGNEAHLAWSPDGTRLLFTSSRTGFKDEAALTYAPQPYGEIFVMNADGTNVQQLTDNQWEDGGPAWQPAKPTPSTVTAAVH
jgi:Tol biopolymer transport system component